jgi:hypothetical protein
VWIDDHGWWLGVVDFGSLQWSQGSSLSVGVMWLWRESDHLSFDASEAGARTETFRNETQFARDAEELARTAADQVRRCRDRFRDLSAVAADLTARPSRPGWFWDDYHAGAAAALVGDVPAAAKRLDAVLRADPDVPWIAEAQDWARAVLDAAEDPALARAWAADRVAACRSRLKLASVTVSFEV